VGEASATVAGPVVSGCRREGGRRAWVKVVAVFGVRVVTSHFHKLR
jgi:hypothetical protein